MGNPIRVGCIGAGGIAATHIRDFLQAVSSERARLTAICTSRPEAAAADPHVQASGAKILGTPEELLALSDLDALIVPTGIDTHLHYSSLALQAGKHVMCEKPVAGTIQDARKMAQARDRFGKSLAVGFQDTYLPSSRWARERIAAGDIGTVERASLCALWPRAQSYYQRNAWAGKNRTDKGWVLDSPAMNALAHQINLLLWLTAEPGRPINRVTSVEAELYRAWDVEGFDTCAVRCRTEGGCEILILLTHACSNRVDPTLFIQVERGAVERELLKSYRIVSEQNPAGERACEKEPIAVMHDEWIRFLEGSPVAEIYSVEQAAEHTRLICALSEHCPVVTVDPASITEVPDGHGSFFRSLADIQPLFEKCREDFLLPHEVGLTDWTEPGRQADIGEYDTFSGVFGE